MKGASSSWLRERPWLVDVVVALAVFAYNLPIQVRYVPDGLWPGTGTVVAVGLCAPYVLRQRHPLPVFGIILLTAWLQLVLGVGFIPADIMLAFALYNVAVRFQWPISAPAAAAVVLWVLLAVGPRLEEYYLSPSDLGLLVLVVVTAWTWGTTVRIRRDYVDGLKERARQLEREQESQARIVAAAERARIAREIHDIVSHSLSVVVVMAEGASLKVHSEPERAEQAMLTVRDTGRDALAEMRRMLDVLRDGEPGSRAPSPGIAQLGRLIEESRTSGLPVEMTLRGEPVEVSAGVDLVVYRVIQEALTNARKHAGPLLSKVAVRLRYGGDSLEVRVTDDGQGPGARPGSEPGGGHGLVGMRERVAAYGGKLRTGPRPGGGFEVVATLPIGGGD
ncbi:sensor histidine kinase [Rubrobacter tropicus]|uniref:sensor histidine kinase n=1 Tax=Rubrobacter tropicus TaxID=2653851 RepID=UPI001A9EE64A|nr:sensor histidine kinase [Rubrobacter tropicus]